MAHPRNPDAGLNFDKEVVKGRQEPPGTMDTFLLELEADAAIKSETEAKDAARVVLCELERHLSSGVVGEVKSQLPPRLRTLMDACARLEHSPKRRASARDFVTAVSDLLNVNPDKGERIVRAVFTAVRDRLPEHEVAAAAAQLPPDLANLWRRPV